MFQIKNFVSIAASMINHMKGTQANLTDFYVGSVARTMIEAPAIEIDEFYQQMVNGLTEAIPVATYRSFNFNKLDAVAASNIIVVTIAVQAVDVLIPAGTVFTFDGAETSYVSAIDVTITQGNTTANVLCSAAVAGVVGNIADGKSFIPAPAPNGFVSATNPLAFKNGTDAETNDQIKQRFVNYVTTLQRGTIPAIEYGLSTARVYNASGTETERVASSSIVEPYVADNTQPTGLVYAYIHNGTGSTSGDLVTAAQAITNGYTDASGNKIPGYKAAGVVVVVEAASEVSLNLTGVITSASGYVHADLVTQAISAVANYIGSLAIGESFLLAESVALVMAIPGITNFVISLPTSDHTATASQKIMPGMIAIT